MRGIRLALAVTALTAFVISSAPAQPPRGKGGAGMMQMFQRGGTAMLIANSSVQTELKLNDDQKAKFKEFADKQAAKMREMFADGGFDREKMQEMAKESTEKVEKLIKDTLNKDQFSRFGEIKLQQAGIAAFAEKSVESALKLKDAQKEKIKGITEEMTQDVRELMQEMRGGGGGGNFQEIQQKTQALRKEALEKATGVLTSEQKAQFKEMLGKPFEIKMDEMRRGEGKGGRKKGDDKKGDGKSPPKSNPKIDD